ncbi:alanine racemase [Spirochaetota bacterium]|nr:alanine racemase [Spirochaetota bacterium]
MQITSPVARTTLTVNLDAITANVRTIKMHANKAKVMAVLKANAYGIGVGPVIKAVLNGGAAAIGIATHAEAAAARRFFQGPIYLLGAYFEGEITELLDLDIIFPVSSEYTLTRLNAYATKNNKIAQFHLLIDTGMGRLGTLPETVLELIKKSHSLPNVSFLGCYSHLSNAFTPNDPHTQKQITTFKTLKDKVLKLHTELNLPSPPPCFHLANSDGIHNYPETSLDMIRVGINLYGFYDLQGHRRYALEPALTLSSKIIAIRKLPAKASIGYGITYRLPHAGYVATISAGYADGIPLALANRFHVIIGKQTYPIIGRISMDYLTVWLDANTYEVNVGDNVILLGRHNQQCITIDEWAELKQTHPYDIITSLSPRVTRVYEHLGIPQKLLTTSI